MPPRPDTTRRTRQANLRERRRAAGLVNRNLWLTPEQAATIDAYLKTGTAPPTATSDALPSQSVDSDATSDSSQGAAVADADPLLTQTDAAAYLDAAESMFRYWRKAGTGPAFEEHGGRFRYRRGALDAWKATGWTKQPGGRRRNQP